MYYLRGATLYQKFDYRYYTTGGYHDYRNRFVDEARTIIVPSILRHIKPQKHWVFLDVGCGLGGTIIALQECGYRASGVEVSPYCLEQSPIKKHIAFGECSDLPYGDSSFDVAICLEVFVYLNEDDIHKTMKELVRVAKKYIVFSTFDKFSPFCSQEYNPDDLRLSSDALLSGEDYIRLFEQTGCTLVAKNILPIEEYDFSAVFRCPSPG